MQVTLVPDAAKADGKPVVSVVAPVTISGTSTVAFASAQQVFVVGGTVQTTVSFAGSVQTGIGNVKIEDADGNYAVVPEAGVAKTGATKALVVQHIDDAGIPFRQATQVSILNNQGTLATSACQVSANGQLAAILNTQGTQSTAGLAADATLISIRNDQGTLATSAYQVAIGGQLAVLLNTQGTQSTAGLATDAALVSIRNDQGTLATSALQSAGNSMLAVIMNGQGTVADSAAELNLLRAVMNNQGTQASSALQTTGNATLTTIMNNQGTLAPGAALGKTQLVANDGVTLIESDIDSAGDQHLGVRMVQAIYASAKNTYGSNLSAGAVFYGTTETTLGVAGIQSMLRTDTNCTVFVDQSGDSGTHWDVTDLYLYYYANGGQSWTTQAVGDTFRVRVQNTGTGASSYFRLATALCPVVEAVPRALSSTGNFRVEVAEMLPTFGITVKASPTGQLRSVQSVRLVGAVNGDSTVLDTNFWGSNAVGTGTIVPGGNQFLLQTGTVTGSSVNIQSVRSGRYISGNSNYFRGVIDLPAVTGANTRRWGAYNANDGFFFETDGTVLTLVCRKGGSDLNRISSGGFNGAAGNSYILANNTATYEIYWTNKSAWFWIDDRLVHKFTGATAPLTNTCTLFLSADNINGANTNSNSLEARALSLSRLGQYSTQPILKNLSTNATQVLKYGPGILHRITLNSVGGSGNVLAVYDGLFPSAAASWGTFAVGVVSNASPHAGWTFDAPFYTGLCTVLSTASAANLNIIYE